MEQAVNSFIKGLQSDTHPMAQGNETMSDALNATIITSNGNEVILQNDMGNRRVNNAFLPSGYEPVGVKEYGGIIYVAAYNPITNKSQIGSFPSPQKKIDGLVNDDLGGTFDIDNFNFNPSPENENTNIERCEDLNNIWVLKNDSFLIPITNDTSLRAGDKYSIYSEDLYNDEIINNITNYKNVDSNSKKALSPKNKKYTISVGVLNSQNQFIDITKTLRRISDDGNYKTYDDSFSDVYKFNDEYFIAKSKPNINNTETIEDNKLILTRQKLALNTYSYKLAGPLYLKFSLNHIVGFDYNIDGIYYQETNTATLWIDGYLTYNCPDEIEYSIIRGNENYYSFDEGVTKLNGFDLLDNGTLMQYKDPQLGEDSPLQLYLIKDVVTLHDGKITSNGRSTYDPITNLYRVKITKRFDNVVPNYYTENDVSEKSTIYNYILGVSINKFQEPSSARITNYEEWMGNIEGRVNKEEYNGNLYLKNLSIKNTIDLSKLGTGEIKLVGWKFSNTIDVDNNKLTNTYIRYSFIKYPKKNEKFVNLRFKFVNISDPSDIVYYPENPLSDPTNNNGVSIDEINNSKTINITWSDSNRPKLRHVYGVTYTYGVYNEETKKLTTYDEYGQEIFSSGKELNMLNEDKTNNISESRPVIDPDGADTGQTGESESTGEIMGEYNYNIKPVNQNDEQPPSNINDNPIITSNFKPLQNDDTTLINIDENNKDKQTIHTEPQNITQFNLWYISTKLFNDIYDKPDIINFCTIETNPGKDGYNSDFANLLNVNYNINLEETEPEHDLSQEFDGDIVSQNSNINYTVTTTDTITIGQKNVNIEIENEFKYPEWINPYNNNVIFNQAFISFDGNKYIEINQSEINKIKSEFKKYIEIENNNYNNLNVEDLFDISSNFLKNKVKIVIKNRDKLVGTGKKVDIKDVFTSLENVLMESNNGFLPRAEGFCGPIANGDFGHDGNTAYYDFILNSNYEKITKCDDEHCGYPPDDEHWLGDEKYEYRKQHESSYVFNVADDIEYGKKISEKINSSIICTYLDVGGEKGVSIIKEDCNNENIEDIVDHNNHTLPIFGNYIDINDYFTHYGSFYRIFWRVNGENWAMFEKPIIKEKENENITIEDIMGLFKKDYIYCAYQNYSSNFYAPNNYAYNKYYSLDSTLKIYYALENSEDVISIPYKIGNLEFKYIPNSNNTENSFEYNIKIKSSEKFSDVINNGDTIENMKNNGIQNVYYNRENGIGTRFDSNGDLLNPENVYYEENGKLKVLNNSSSIFKVKKYNPVNQLLLNIDGITQGKEDIEYRYYAYINGVKCSVLDFKDVLLVNQNNV